jgi:hypothetical protein
MSLEKKGKIECRRPVGVAMLQLTKQLLKAGVLFISLCRSGRLQPFARCSRIRNQDSLGFGICHAILIGISGRYESGDQWKVRPSGLRVFLDPGIQLTFVVSMPGIQRRVLLTEMIQMLHSTAIPLG